MAPFKPVDEIQDPVRLLQLAVQESGSVHGIEVPEVVDEDVEVRPVGGVVGGGEGAEASPEGVDAVEGEELDGEGEVLRGRARVPVGGERGELGVLGKG